MTRKKNTQENFWKGTFGSEYSKRNKITNESYARSLVYWSGILKTLPERPKSILELGSNIGINLHALKSLVPEAKICAVEINSDAAAELREADIARVHEMSILDFNDGNSYDLVICMGVLIHINPDSLEAVYEVINKHASSSVVLSTYYNPYRREVRYRGYDSVLYQGDFAGEFMDKFPEYKLLSYAFNYHRDPVYPGADGTWFSLAK